MSKLLWIIFIMLLCTNNTKAQTTEDSVKAVINKMFIAMKESDAITLLQCFTETAILQTVSEKNDSVSVLTEQLKEFADFVHKQPKGAADERITFDMVKANGPLAIAWTPYQFYYDGKFIHCGIDSYQLVRMNGEWKIQYLVDTRRKAGCE